MSAGSSMLAITFLQLPAAAPARLDLDREHAFEPLRPRRHDFASLRSTVSPTLCGARRTA
jgi:hypothetical protein